MEHASSERYGGSGRRGAAEWTVAAAIGLAVVLWTLSVLRLGAALAPGDVPFAVAGLLLGALAADALTGLVHWACDTWGDERTPWLGPTLIYAFREHHVSPLAMLDRDWTSTNREPGLTAAVALLLLSLPVCQRALEGQVVASAFLCSFAFYGATANQLHLWAHDPNAPRLVRRAQRLGLVLSPERHARHHRAPHTRAYCISTGWLDPLLDRTGFWRWLERRVSVLTGSAARAGDAAPRTSRSAGPS